MMIETVEVKEATKQKFVSGKAATKATLSEKIAAKIKDFGISQKKAQELAKLLVPTVRAAVRKEMSDKVKVVSTVKQLNAYAEEKETSKVEQSKLSQPKLAASAVLPCTDVEGAVPLQIQHGRTTTGTYLVMAVKGPNGILSARKFNDGPYKVKFFPDLNHWGLKSFVSELGSVYDRPSNHYQGVVINEDKLTKLMSRVGEMASPFARFKALTKRFLVSSWAVASKKFPTSY